MFILSNKHWVVLTTAGRWFKCFIYIDLSNPPNHSKRGNARGHIASKWWNWDSNFRVSIPTQRALLHLKENLTSLTAQRRCCHPCPHPFPAVPQPRCFPFSSLNCLPRPLSLCAVRMGGWDLLFSIPHFKCHFTVASLMPPI